MHQVNTLSNIRKARLGRLDPVFKNKVKVQTRTYDIMPPELVAVHEAKSRISIAKRLTAQGMRVGFRWRDHVFRNWLISPCSFSPRAPLQALPAPVVTLATARLTCSSVSMATTSVSGATDQAMFSLANSCWIVEDNS